MLHAFPMSAKKIFFAKLTLNKYTNLCQRKKDSNPRKYCYYTHFPSILIKKIVEYPRKIKDENINTECTSASNLQPNFY